MSTIMSVKLKQLIIVNGGDNFSKGDIYYELKINGKTVANRDINQYITVADGTAIHLNDALGYFDLATSPLELIISGKVSDRDGTIFEGADDSISFIDDYSSGKKKSSGRDLDTNDSLVGVHSSFFGNPDMSFRLEYEIMDPGPVLGPGSTGSRVPQDEDGGVVLYVYPNYNNNSVPDNTRITGVYTTQQQFFLAEENGEYKSYDLPHKFSDMLRIRGLSPKTASSLKIGEAVSVAFYDKPLAEKSTAQIFWPEKLKYDNLSIVEYTGDLEEGWNNKIVSMEFFSIRGPQ